MSPRKSREGVWKEWKDLVNMLPAELEEWLVSDESKSVGDSSDGESTGPASGRKTQKIKKTNK
ncbi:DUF3140 domain-containing protein [Halomonas marinisediminis]|uniref:DUF3140 domain-containing protein n=1 Tax=Halomonas marinisediminis TaxID=2546095 RepID=A0ABY2D834_9GAMM|nr:DUF3140 domain-containing protein [Halomonas marinisediminis]